MPPCNGAKSRRFACCMRFAASVSLRVSAMRCKTAGVSPGRLSFARTRGLLEEMRCLLVWSEGEYRGGVVQALDHAVGSYRLVDRADRVEQFDQELQNRGTETGAWRGQI